MAPSRPRKVQPEVFDCNIPRGLRFRGNGHPKKDAKCDYRAANGRASKQDFAALITPYIGNLPDTGTAPMGTGSDDRATGVRASGTRRSGAISVPTNRSGAPHAAFLPGEPHEPGLPENTRRRSPIPPAPSSRPGWSGGATLHPAGSRRQEELYEGPLRWQSSATNRATGRRERQVIHSQAHRDLRFTDGSTRPDAPLLRPADTLRPPAISVTIAASG